MQEEIMKNKSGFTLMELMVTL
ncbi:MAG: prepilin-type N-terminal cleavage/methylation domain-containing protein, partial [Deltaproteobacteria bacterium]|nr:prepilin-type N-terminal cleavage/methylation domain-containing protein [Deltaproteobacteria bacterium]